MAWSLFEKRDTDALGRIVSARTLDGTKIRAKLQLTFPRPVTQTDAENIMMRYARLCARTIERELCGGRLPFDEQELTRRLTSDLQDLPRESVRVTHLLVQENPEDTAEPASTPGLARAHVTRPEASVEQAAATFPEGLDRVPLPRRTRSSALVDASGRTAGSGGAQRPEPHGPADPVHGPGTQQQGRRSPASSKEVPVAPTARGVSGLRTSTEPQAHPIEPAAAAAIVRRSAARVAIASLHASLPALDDPLEWIRGTDHTLRASLLRAAWRCVQGLFEQVLSEGPDGAKQQRWAHDVLALAMPHQVPPKGGNEITGQTPLTRLLEDVSRALEVKPTQLSLPILRAVVVTTSEELRQLLGGSDAALRSRRAAGL